MIKELTGDSHDPRKVNRAPSYEGLHCEAGAWYFTVDKTGEAYSCRTGKRFLHINEGASLGNLVDGTFQLRSRGGACPYPICPCTVPANRGIVRINNKVNYDVEVKPIPNLVSIGKPSGDTHGN